MNNFIPTNETTQKNGQILRNKFPKLTQEEKENMHRPITSK